MMVYMEWSRCVIPLNRSSGDDSTISLALASPEHFSPHAVRESLISKMARGYLVDVVGLYISSFIRRSNKL